MKKLRITLNEKIYDVQVEVLEDDESYYPGAGHPVTVPGYARDKAAEPDTPPAVQRRRPTGSPGGNVVMAPIVGTVTRILVEVGAQVKENQPLIVLDAMKMDTYINAPRSGTIASIECKVGDSVHVGQKLISLN
jgi:glutaconyl-CoA/methylmalonyl-CoA decarboxylase subunit gamma